MASFREIATDALRFWEPRRLLYNGILAAVTGAAFFACWPASRRALNGEAFGTLFLLAVLANLLYCAAYVPDVFVQFSDFRESWRRWRFLLFAVGLTLAATLAFSIALTLSSPFLND